MVDLYSATSIYPEILEAVLSSSFSTEADFGVASLALACSGHKLIIRDFLAFESKCAIIWHTEEGRHRRKKLT
jgi:hypothetical protein